MKLAMGHRCLLNLRSGCQLGMPYCHALALYLDMQSLCVQAGVVEAAPAPKEGSQQRRKRKREKAMTAESTPLLGAVQWANPAAYKRAFRQACPDLWLSVCMHVHVSCIADRRSQMPALLLPTFSGKRCCTRFAIKPCWVCRPDAMQC